MRRVVWSETAIRELAKIRAHISQFSPFAGNQVTTALHEAGKSLSQNPDRGRPIPGGKRELAIVRPYLTRYRVMTEVVHIIRIRHAARRPR